MFGIINVVAVTDVDTKTTFNKIFFANPNYTNATLKMELKQNCDLFFALNDLRETLAFSNVWSEVADGGLVICCSFYDERTTVKLEKCQASDLQKRDQKPFDNFILM